MTLTFALALAAHVGLAGVASDSLYPDSSPTQPTVASPAPRALAQDGNTQSASTGSGTSTSQSGKKKKVIRLDALTVEGRIQKPQAFYILQRSNLNFEELNRTESFIPKVEKSVEATPF